MLGKDLDRNAHLLQLYRKNRSQLFYNQLRLFFSALVWIYRDTYLAHCLFDSHRWMGSSGPGADGVAGDYGHDLSCRCLYDLSSTVCCELKFAALLDIFG